MNHIICCDHYLGRKDILKFIIDSWSYFLRYIFLNIFYCCRYPEDRVPLHTSSKSRQGARRVSTHSHVSCCFRPHLSAEMCSGATTCPAAPDLASLLRWAPALLRVPRLWTLPPWRGEVRCCHMSHGSRLCLPERGAPVLPHVSRLRALPS
jgi:hypothetical protein